MGVALSHALCVTIEKIGNVITPSSDVTMNFAQALLRELDIGAETYTVSLDSLTQDDNLALLLNQTLAASPSKWGRDVARRLDDAAAPIFNRQRMLEHDIAAEIRLASLCLAAENRHFDDESQSFKKLQHMAAAVTMLESRLCGDGSPRETIFLALSP